MTKAKKIIAAITAAATVISAGATAVMVSAESSAPVTSSVKTQSGTLPKYIFMFIGDGMSYPQIQVTADYYSALADKNDNDILEANKTLNFVNFPVVGTANTYDSSSFCPDSASTATSLATGYKTYSGSINVDETGTIEYETIAEKLKEQMGYKIGVISSVNLNHATPAAYYAHQASRNSYYEIGLEMIESDFDYFAGGGLKKVNGADGESENLYELAEEAGYKVIFTQEEAEALTAEDGKAIVIGETLADSDSLSYHKDRASDEWELADYVEKGIEVLDNETGFFMMCEAGKIDWACHANDAGSTISDVKALNNAVAEALEFYNEHPDETLIIVTGDHETGGLTIGFAGTEYDTFLTNLNNQKISYAKYDSDYIAKYRENGTSFEAAMKDVEKLFGLVRPERASVAKSDTLVLTEYEVQRLKDAYELSMAGTMFEQYDVTYGPYEPFSVTVTHILNNKSGIDFSSYCHTGLPVAVFAKGAGAELFDDYYDNTQIYDKLAALTGVK